jgi:predicted TIM-barrel fold metal-dependent hydrolase
MPALDLSALPIVDHHAHATLRRVAIPDAVHYRRWFTESTDATVHAQHVPHSIVYRTALRWLGEFVGCEPTAEAIIAARDATDERAWAERFFTDANIETILCDYGYGSADAYGPDAFPRMVPCRVESILRLETTAERLLREQPTFDAFVDAFTALVGRARADGHVGLKSIAAYRTGLEIEGASEAAAYADYRALKATAEQGGRVRLAHKALNDFLVLRALELAAAQGLPVQFHTGFGDSDADLRTANPLHLRAVIERFPGVPLVLLHAGWPFWRELSHLAAIYPNVWLDLSLAVPFATAGLPGMVRDVLGMAPLSKVLFATDAFTMPEIYWIAARWGRWSLGRVLGEFVDEGFLGEAEALDAAADILAGNARRVYGV